MFDYLRYEYFIKALFDEAYELNKNIDTKNNNPYI